MRRWLVAVALGSAAVLAVAGCGNPGGVDGELTDDWAAVGEPQPFVPDAGTCHPRFQEIGFLSVYNPVDCSQLHEVETIHLGTFTGKDAERTSPPPAGSAARRTAWGECDKKATEALGADWRTARLLLSVVLPPPQGWSGGARWFRCDLSEVKSVDDADWVSRTGSLKGTLSAPSPLSYGCFEPKLSKDGEHIEEMVAVACDKPHRSEFAGIYSAPETSHATFEKRSNSIHSACRGVIAGYVKVPNNSDMRYRTGTIFYSPTEEQWEAGDRGVKCFLWLSERKLTKSLKGAGTKGLPVN